MKRNGYTIIYALKRAVLTCNAREAKYETRVDIIGHYDTLKEARAAEAEAAAAVLAAGRAGVSFRIERQYY
jgi:hypothetical protein